MPSKFEYEGPLSDGEIHEKKAMANIRRKFEQRTPLPSAEGEGERKPLTLEELNKLYRNIRAEGYGFNAEE